jgi:hypothetical protein
MNSEECDKERQEIEVYVHVAICRRVHEIWNKRIYTSE